MRKAGKTGETAVQPSWERLSKETASAKVKLNGRNSADLRNSMVRESTESTGGRGGGGQARSHGALSIMEDICFCLVKWEP